MVNDLMKWAGILGSLATAYLIFVVAGATPLPNFIDYGIAGLFAFFGLFGIYQEVMLIKIGSKKKIINSKFFLLVLTLSIFLVSGCIPKLTSGNPSTSKITPSSDKLSGYLTDLKISGNSFQIGNSIIVSGNFHAQSDGNYYIESGLPEASYKAFGILKSSQSACDQNVHYAGIWVNNLKAGDTVPFELSIKDYGKTGKYDIVGGVYSKCGVGADIASFEPISVSITAPQSAVDSPPASSVSPQPVPPITQCTPSGYFTYLNVRTLGTGDSSDNSKGRVVGSFHNAASCTATYYIEAGMLQSTYRPLSVAQGVPSACDSNVHFSGVKVTLAAGQDQSFILYPQNYGIDGRYKIQGGVYYNKGVFCGNADIASFAEQDVTFAGFSASAVDNSWIKVI